MKTKLLALFSLLLFVSSSYSQNWKLLDENKTYFYKHIDSLYITNTISIDSAQGTPSDTTFHVRTRFKVCDTCTVIPWQSTDGILYHAFAPEIFGHVPVYTVATNDYLFSDGIIKHHAQLSDSWIFDSGLGITATVVDTDELTVFSVLDSIKIIQLSTLDTIIISKNNGIIRYPDFDNVGKYFLITGYTDGQNAFGEFVPNMWQIYDFSVGDVFCYTSSEVHMDDAEISSSQIELKILEDLSVADTLIYKIKYYHSTHYEYWGPWPEDAGPDYTIAGISIHIFKFPFDKFLPQNSYGAYASTPTNILDWPANTNFMMPTNINDQCFESDNQEFGYINQEYDGVYGYLKKLKQFSFYGDSLCYSPSGINSNNVSLYAEGTGLVQDNYGCFETQYDVTLVGSTIDGITTGTVYNFPEDLGFENLQSENLFIYPNPTNSQITIPTNLQMISIYSITGNLVLQLENPTQQIYVGDLPAGIYFVHGFDLDGNRMETKLVVSK